MKFYLVTPLLTLLAASCLAETFTNPIIWEDLPDNEVIRVDDTFYMTTSTMHFSPGAPLLRSYDLVNFEHIGHSVPVLDWSSKYDLTNGENAYIKGIWASTIRHRPSDNKWYFIACIEFSKSYVYVADSPTGPWTQLSEIDNCYYDAGLLFDGETPYVAYGNTQLSVAQLSTDLTTEVKHDVVYSTPSDIGTLEGSRMYRKDDNYYLFVTKPPNAQYVLKSSSPWGPYEARNLVNIIQLKDVPTAGSPHQGSLVDTPAGDWYYMGFSDMYPGGRCPVLAPITWGDDGFPTVVTDNGAWGSYDYPLPRVDVTPSGGMDIFVGPSLGLSWEWNHNPDTTKYSVNYGLNLQTVSVTDDLYAARNTLTHRIRGPVGTGIAHIDFANMATGDRAGLAALRDSSAWIGVERQGDQFNLLVTTGLTMNSDWSTSSKGSVVARVDNIQASKVFLRLVANIQPGASGSGQFAYSMDGTSFTELGPAVELGNSWEFFMGYRYGIFNYATESLGGSVTVLSFNSWA